MSAEGGENKERDFLARLSNFAEETDFHGLRRCMHPQVSLIRRLIWTVLVSASFSYFMYGVANRIKHFQSSPHSTRVDLLYVSTLEFPSVTICNVNSHRLSPLTNDDLFNYGQALGILDENWHLLHPSHYDREFRERIRSVDWANYRSGKFDLAEFTRRTGHQVQDLVLMCQWRDEECGPENFTHIFTSYGNCYTFNSGRNLSILESKKPGRAHGLNLYLNLEEYDYLNNEQTVHAGFKILLHHKEEPPLVDELGVGLQSENHYLIAIRKEKITNLPQPYGNCADDFEMEYYKEYSVAGCRLECTSASIIRNCSCRMLHLPDMGSEAPLCTVEQTQECANPTLDIITESDECVCQTPCSMTKYNMMMSSLKIRHEMVDKLKERNRERIIQHVASGEHTHPNSSVEFITSDNIVAVNIFYESLNYEIVEQYAAYPSEALFGDVGGQIGLFVGASILTVAHFLEYILDELLILQKRVRSQRLLKMSRFNGFPGLRSTQTITDRSIGSFRGSISVLRDGIGIYQPGGPIELKVNGHDLHIMENTHAVIECDDGGGFRRLGLYPSQLSLDGDIQRASNS